MFQCCLNLCCIFTRSREYYSTKKTPNEEILKSEKYENPKEWMKKLNGDMLISEINIPGTHQTMSQHLYYGLSVAQCQTLKLIDQLNIGVRYLDIRVKEDKQNKIPIFHSTAFQKAHFEKDVIDVCDKFLREHPTELIIITIRIELNDFGATSFNDHFDDIVKRKRPDLFALNKDIPSLQSVRGKIWMWPGNNWFYNKGFSFNENMEKGRLFRQDFYELTVSKKKIEVELANKEAIKNKSQRILANCVKWYHWPVSVSKSMNKFIHQKQLYEGIVVLDFPGEMLIKKIIESNFIQSRKQSDLIREQLYNEQTVFKQDDVHLDMDQILLIEASQHKNQAVMNRIQTVQIDDETRLKRNASE